MSPPEILRFGCYREYLKHLFDFKKSTRAGFSYRRFSALVGLKSPNYLQLVIQGKRNLTPATAERIAETFKLSAKETQYFVALVRRESAESEKDRVLAEKEIFRAMKALRTTYLKKQNENIFDEWFYLPVRELVFLPDFEPTGEFAHQKLSGLVSIEEGEKAFQFLIAQGYLKVVDSKWRAEDPVLDAGHDLFLHQRLQEYHQKTLAVWARHLPALGLRDQELGLLNIPLPREQIPVLQQKIRQFQDEVIGWAQQFSEGENLIQLGTYLVTFQEDGEKS